MIDLWILLGLPDPLVPDPCLSSGLHGTVYPLQPGVQRVKIEAVLDKGTLEEEYTLDRDV